MHGETVKFTNVQQAKPYNYKNTIFISMLISKEFT